MHFTNNCEDTHTERADMHNDDECTDIHKVPQADPHISTGACTRARTALWHADKLDASECTHMRP